MKPSRILALVLVTMVFAGTASAAEFGIRFGRYNDAKENFVGVEALIDLGTINLNPNLEYSLADEITAGSANLDVTFDLGRFEAVTPFLGAGLGLAYFDDDIGDSRTDVVGNLIGGAAFDVMLKPYVQVKYFRVLENDDRRGDEVALTVGIRF